MSCHRPVWAGMSQSRVADALVRGSENPDWHLVAVHYERAERFDEAADASGWQRTMPDAAAPSTKRAPTSPEPSDRSNARSQVRRAIGATPAPPSARLPRIGGGRNRQPAGRG